jgi:AraC family transcriptional regulator of adaptative response/methylated-DNA-[protein]-cysteine methyltransferase
MRFIPPVRCRASYGDEKGLCGSPSAAPEKKTQCSRHGCALAQAEFRAHEYAIAPYAERIFSSVPAAKARCPSSFSVTPWQIKVWQALLAIPEGEVTSYRRIAEKVCTARPRARPALPSDAIRLRCFIPCHRVLAANGALTGYHWGESRKARDARTGSGAFWLSYFPTLGSIARALIASISPPILVAGLLFRDARL